MTASIISCESVIWAAKGCPRRGERLPYVPRIPGFEGWTRYAEQNAGSELCSELWKNAKKSAMKSRFQRHLLAFAPHALAEDETWRRGLVSVSATPSRVSTGKTNAPAILPDFLRVTPGKRRVIFCRQLIILWAADYLVGSWLFSFFLQAGRFTFLASDFG